METYIDPISYRVDPDYDHEAHMERYPLKLAGLSLPEYFAIKAVESGNNDDLREAA